MANCIIRILNDHQKQLLKDCQRIAKENNSDLSKETRKFWERYRKENGG